MKRRSGVGRWQFGGVIAPDAHTPTPTNYHCIIENKEEVKIEVTQTQRDRLSISLHKDRKKVRRTVQVTGNILHLSLW